MATSQLTLITLLGSTNFSYYLVASESLLTMRFFTLVASFSCLSVSYVMLVLESTPTKLKVGTKLCDIWVSSESLNALSVAYNPPVGSLTSKVWLAITLRLLVIIEDNTFQL